MEITHDYNKFSARKYLEEQNSTIEQDEEFMMKFFHDTYDKLTASKYNMLELGGGPTIYQLISARNHVKKIIFTDYLQDNLNEVASWFAKKTTAFNWDSYFRYIAKLEGKKVNKATIEKMKNELRTTLIELTQFDIYQKNIPKNIARGSFDIVSVNFFPEVVATDHSSFKALMKIILSFVKKEGIFVMNALKNKTTYKNGGKTFHMLPIDEQVVRNALSESGFVDIEIYSADIVRTTGHNLTMFIRAKKSSARRKKISLMYM